jgi:hypothetical protein
MSRHQGLSKGDGTTFTDKRVQTWLAGKVSGGDGETVDLAGSNYYLLRITEGRGRERFVCYDFVVDYSKDFSRTIALADPSSLQYYVSKSIVNPVRIVRPALFFGSRREGFLAAFDRRIGLVKLRRIR